MEKIILLKAGEEVTSKESATSLVIVSTGGSTSLEISILDTAGAVLNKFKESLKMGFEFNAPDGLNGLRFKSDTDTRVVYIVTRGNAKVNIIDGAQLNAKITNTLADPVPVRGNVSVTNFPAVQTIQGNVTAVIDQSGGALAVQGNVSVTGNVTATIAVDPNAAPLPVTGNITVTSAIVTQGTQTQDRYSQDDSLTMFKPFDATRKRWIIQNVSDWEILLGIGTGDMQDHTATIELAAGERYIEDNPLIAAQEIHLRTLSDITTGGFPNGNTALFNYQDLLVV